MDFKSGLLWFDDSGRTLEEKVVKAAARYEAKHGHAPDLCLVHPGVFAGSEEQVVRAGEIEIRPGRAVLAHHFWLGVTEAPRKGKPATVASGSQLGSQGTPATAGEPGLTRRVATAGQEPLSPERARQRLAELEVHA
jgi:hypothetical protein